MTSGPFAPPFVYPILDAQALRGRSLGAAVRTVAAAGARVVQVRAKTMADRIMLELVEEALIAARAAGVALLVNDRADVARLAGADGVHVGQDDLAPAAARILIGPAAIVGLSTHTEPQIDAALVQPVTYIAVGPIFGTSTKATGYTAVALDRVRYAAARIGREAEAKKGHERIGLVAIGGITLDRAAEVIAAGATAVAVITDLLASGNPEDRVRAYLARLSERGKV